MKTLFINFQKPYPPMGGLTMRNWQNISLMIQFSEVHVITLDFKKSENEDKFSSPYLKTYQEFDLTFLRQQRSIQTKIINKLWYFTPLGHPQINWLKWDVVKNSLMKFILKEKPNLIIFQDVRFYYYFQKIKSLQKSCQFKVIYDAHNVEGKLFKDIYLSQNLVAKSWYSKFYPVEILPFRIKRLEQRFVREADQVWVCSEDDANLMREMYGQNLSIEVIPNGINVSDYETLRLGKYLLPDPLDYTPHTIVFPATFSYEPNSVAVKLLIEEIYPQLQKIYPDCRLILVGREPTKLMKETAKNNSNIIVTDKVPDVKPYLAAASVMVVPLQQGGGTRLKILEAFASGIPVVSTSKGAEGLKAQDGQHLLIRDNMEEIVAGITQLWSEPSLGKQLTDNAFELVKSEYSWEAVGQRVKAITFPS